MSLVFAEKARTALGTVAGALVLTSALAVITWRLSLAALVIVGGAFLVWTTFRSGRSLRGRALLVCVSAVFLAVLPVDVAFARTGHLGVKLVPLWGLPSAAGFDQARAGEVELAGCVIPANAARYVIRFSW